MVEREIDRFLACSHFVFLQEVIQLRGRLKLKNEQVSQLHQLLTEKELQPDSLMKTSPPSQRTRSYTDILAKENLLPKHDHSYK